MRAIITYHSLDRSGSVISLSPESFRSHVDWLASGRVRVVTVEELLVLNDTVDAVALTFDDGFSNFATEAAPLLRERGLPATVFVVTGHVGGDNRWRGRTDAGIPVLPLLGWDDLGALRESGFTLGAHTRTHANLLTLGEAEVAEDLGGAADEMHRRLGERPKGFAYPYGAVDAVVAQTSARHYQWACTTEFRSVASRDPMTLLPRLDAWYFREPDRLARWGSPGFRAWLWHRRQLRRARATMQRMGGTRA
jgi:peptidoglycan/xylan/chitin deacetylase (PgdA/CDA1 family)